MDESWIDELVDEPIDLQPRPGFESQLRTSLIEEWNGRSLPSRVDHRDRARPRLWWRAGAAAVVAILVGGLVIVVRDDDGGTVVTPTPSDVQPAGSTAPSTAPTTSATSAVAPSTTTVPTTMAVPAPPAGTRLLAGWPPPPPDDRSALEAVPRLLPTVPIPGADGAVRSELIEAPVEYHDYEQTWFSADGASILTISTNVAQPHFIPASQQEAIEMPPWDQAFFKAETPGSGIVSMWLSGPEGHVVLRAFGLDRDLVADIAWSLAARSDDAPGWNVPALPDSMIAFDEGWNSPSASRTLRWFAPNDTLLAEMWITRGVPSTLTIGAFMADDREITTIGDAPAVATQTAGRTAVAWSPEPGIAVLVGVVGTLDQGLQIARSIEPTDLAEWEASSTPDTSGDDGCLSLFC